MYFYAKSTGTSNLRSHLRIIHPTEYDEAVAANGWPYKLSTEVNNPSAQNSRDDTTRIVPPFSPEAFLEYLIHFIVADDQVWLINVRFFRTLTNLLVNSCCRMPRISTTMHATPGNPP